MDRSETQTQPDLAHSKPIQAHLVGGRDDAMAGLARWLADEGYEVSQTIGSARVDSAHHPVSLPHTARWLVYSPDVSREHSDRLVAARDGIAQASYPAVVRQLLGRKQGIAVAGQRQGRTTAAMIGWTLAQAGFDPSVLLRGNSRQLGGPARAGRGAQTVIDITQALTPELLGEPGPSIAVMLDVAQIDPAERTVLVQLAERVSRNGSLVLANPALMSEASLAENAQVDTLSLEPGSDWWGTDLREERGRFRFRAFHHGQFAAEIRLQVPGRSSVLSALATVAVCKRIEVPTRAIKQALEDFAGISRAFESRGSYRGVTLCDDDAVAASDVAETLALARNLYGRRRLWTVFAPEGPPCCATVAELRAADRILLVEAGVDSGEWAGMLEGAGVTSRRVESLDEAISDLDKHLEPGDVLLTLGAGEVGTIADAFIRRLPRDRQGR